MQLSALASSIVSDLFKDMHWTIHFIQLGRGTIIWWFLGLFTQDGWCTRHMEGFEVEVFTRGFAGNFRIVAGHGIYQTRWSIYNLLLYKTACYLGWIGKLQTWSSLFMWSKVCVCMMLLLVLWRERNKIRLCNFLEVWMISLILLDPMYWWWMLCLA